MAGPITFDIDLSRDIIEWCLKIEKICKLAGVLSRDDARLKKHLLSAKREINQLVSYLSREELYILLEIEEP